MAKSGDRTSKLLAIIPALGAVGAGLVSALQPDNMQKIEAFFSNPLNAGVITAYGAVILAIMTTILFELVRSARIGERRERIEPSEPTTSSTPESAPNLTPEERALRERARYLSSIRGAFTRNRRRMVEEIERIQRSTFLNLVIGIFFSVVALGILGYPLFAPNPTPVTEWLNLVERFVPRLSVGILIQLIGFFFLRLYVAGENELRYIRNEITNLESRMISYNVAAVNDDKIAMTDIIGQLVRTERNFKLKKGERTVYSVDETYNDLAQLLRNALETVRPKVGDET